MMKNNRFQKYIGDLYRDIDITDNAYTETKMCPPQSLRFH